MLVPLLQDEDFIARDSFDDTDQLRVGNDGIFMLTFFSKSTQYFDAEQLLLCFWTFFLSLYDILSLCIMDGLIIGLMVWVCVIYCLR